MSGFYLNGISSINQLVNYSGSYVSGVNQETRELMIRNGQLINGMDVYNSLSAMTSSAVSDANALVADLKAAYPDQIPDYKPFSYNAPKNINETLAAAMTNVRDVLAQKAADPTWTGTKTQKTLREERQLELMEQQNALMIELTDNISSLVNNTNGLGARLDAITTAQNQMVASQNQMVQGQQTQNNMFTNLLNRVSDIQDWLLRMEQQMAAQTSAAAAAAEAAAAAAAAAEASATAAEATTTVVTAATAPTTTTTTTTTAV